MISSRGAKSVGPQCEVRGTPSVPIREARAEPAELIRRNRRIASAGILSTCANCSFIRSRGEQEAAEAVDRGNFQFQPHHRDERDHLAKEENSMETQLLEKHRAKMRDVNELAAAAYLKNAADESTSGRAAGVDSEALRPTWLEGGLGNRAYTVGKTSYNRLRDKDEIAPGKIGAGVGPPDISVRGRGGAREEQQTQLSAAAPPEASAGLAGSSEAVFSKLADLLAKVTEQQQDLKELVTNRLRDPNMSGFAAPTEVEEDGDVDLYGAEDHDEIDDDILERRPRRHKKISQQPSQSQSASATDDYDQEEDEQLGPSPSADVDPEDVVNLTALIEQDGEYVKEKVWGASSGSERGGVGASKIPRTCEKPKRNPDDRPPGPAELARLFPPSSSAGTSSCGGSSSSSKLASRIRNKNRSGPSDAAAAATTAYRNKQLGYEPQPRSGKAIYGPREAELELAAASTKTRKKEKVITFGDPHEVPVYLRKKLKLEQEMARRAAALTPNSSLTATSAAERKARKKRMGSTSSRSTPSLRLLQEDKNTAGAAQRRDEDLHELKQMTMTLSHQSVHPGRHTRAADSREHQLEEDAMETRRERRANRLQNLSRTPVPMSEPGSPNSIENAALRAQALRMMHAGSSSDAGGSSANAKQHISVIPPLPNSARRPESELTHRSHIWDDDGLDDEGVRGNDAGKSGAMLARAARGGGGRVRGTSSTASLPPGSASRLTRTKKSSVSPNSLYNQHGPSRAGGSSSSGRATTAAYMETGRSSWVGGPK